MTTVAVRLREDDLAPDLAAYQRRIDRALRQYDRLEAAEVRAILALLADARRRIVDELAAFPVTDGSYRADQLRAMRQAIEAEAARFAQRADAILADGQDQAWLAGAALMLVALAGTGLALGTLPALARAPLAVARQVSADVVQGLSRELAQRVTREITRGVAGGRSVSQVQSGVRNVLRTTPGRRDGRLGPLVGQAVRVVQTELLGVFNLANRLRQEQIAAEVPGVRKWWQTVGDARVRPAHAAAGARYRPGGTPGPIPVDHDFRVGGERAKGPHDPRLSAKNRVNCRCINVLVLPDEPVGEG